MNPISIIILIAMSLLYSSTGLTQELELTWDGLIPESAVFKDPFASMEREHLEYLGFVARVRAMMESGTEVSSKTKDEVSQIEKELIGAGVDVDGLLAQRHELTELRKKSAKMVVHKINGATVKMPGYLLPLEFRGYKVTEFLLVPWVGRVFIPHHLHRIKSSMLSLGMTMGMRAKVCMNLCGLLEICLPGRQLKIFFWSMVRVISI